jgi:23S rRNA (pseudouridine1915-N3)-methyltransferase
MKVKVISISDSDKHFSSAIQEYCKRLGRDVEIIDLKPEKNGSREQIVTKETEKIISQLQGKDAHVILLLKEGKQLTTEQFVKTIEKNNNLTFVIGWPYGIDLPLLQSHTKESVSFGAMTMPHGLAKLVLLEQIYRAKMIMEGREYHY